jgi:predicted TIM-barrel fold metal-dependent hydrolase
MVIDFHVHIEYKSPDQKYTAQEIVEAMDKGGIDKSVLLGNDQADAGFKRPWADSSMMAVAVNCQDEEIASYCHQFPDRLIGFTSIHPDRYQPHRKVERAVKEFGMQGVKLYPHSGFYPNDPRLHLVYKKCVDFDLPVMIHTGIKAVRWQSVKYNNPIYVDDVAVNFPDLKIIICHGGYPWVEEFMVVAYSNPNIWVDITFLDYIERVYKQPGLTETTMKRLVDLIGTERILWGTEGPYMDLPLFGKHSPDYYPKSQDFLVRRFDFISEEDKKNILGNNAAKLLKIK